MGINSNKTINNFKELFCLLKDKNYSSLFLNSTNNPFIQFFRYVFVGGSAFVFDAGVLLLLTNIGFHYLIAAVLANIHGLIVNYLLSKKIVFVNSSKFAGQFGEFTIYGLIGLVGLILTEIFMFLFTDVIGLYFMFSKIISAILIILWNFLARKFILYI